MSRRCGIFNISSFTWCLWCESAESIPVGRRVSIPSPMEPGIPDRSRQVGLEEEPESEMKHGKLLVAVVRFSQGVSERKTEKERTGRGCFLGDFPDNGEGYGGDSHPFYFPCHQPHGPVAGASGRNQQGIVYPGVGEFTGNRRGGLFL